METLTSEDLVRWCQQTLPDDTRAFERLVTQYKGRVFATAYRLMGNPQEAEDIAQEVFLKIYRSIKTLDEPATLTSWIYRITVNLCFDTLNKHKRRPRTISLFHTTDQREEEPHYVDMQTPQPEEAALRDELRACLEKTLAQLDPAGRTAIVLRDIEGRSYQEIADMLALGLSAVKMRIHRARLTFQELLDRICPGTRRNDHPHDRNQPAARRALGKG